MLHNFINIIAAIAIKNKPVANFITCILDTNICDKLITFLPIYTATITAAKGIINARWRPKYQQSRYYSASVYP